MEDKSQREASYFSVPDSHWRDVGADGYRALAHARTLIDAALAELDRGLHERGETPVADAGTTSAAPLTPAELALQLHEVAGDLLAEVAPDEQDLRQIITTLRTALAVSWDLYSYKESERVTVAEHIRNLRARIEDFERELLTLRQLKGRTNGSSQPPHPNPDEGASSA